MLFLALAVVLTFTVMRIAVDVSLYTGSEPDYHFFGAGFLPHLMVHLPNCEFLLISSQPVIDWLPAHSGKNWLVIPAFGNRKWAKLLWYNVQAIRHLKRWKPDVILSMSGYLFPSTITPQYFFTHDLYWNKSRPATAKFRNTIGKKWINRVAKNATLIFSPFPSPIVPEKQVVTNWALTTLWKPLDWAEKASIQTRFSGGMTYFLCIDGWQKREHFVHLLKGFSLFKKRLQSSMRLVLKGIIPDDEAWQKLLATYKYRSDIVITGRLSSYENMAIMGAAYATVFTPATTDNYKSLWAAIQIGVPAIVCGGTLPAIFEKIPILQAAADDSIQLGELLMQLYKNETFRQTYIDKGLETIGMYTWESIVKMVIEAIHKNHFISNA